MTRQVTEADFRLPEFRNAKVEDYEFRDDGALVRKDRWEMGIRNIASMFGMSREFEIPDVVKAVSKTVGYDWIYIGDEDLEYPDTTTLVQVLFSDGSVLNNACLFKNNEVSWNGMIIPSGAIAWRGMQSE